MKPLRSSPELGQLEKLMQQMLDVAKQREWRLLGEYEAVFRKELRELLDLASVNQEAMLQSRLKQLFDDMGSLAHLCSSAQIGLSKEIGVTSKGKRAAKAYLAG